MENINSIDLWYNSVPIPAYKWEKTAKGFTFTGFNLAAEEITKGAVKNILGTTIDKLYADQPEIQSDFNKCVSENRNIKKELWYHFKESNQLRYLVLQYTPITPELVIVYTEDITERKNAEDNLTRTASYLKEAQQIAGLGYWTYDEKENKYIWSDEMLSIMGFKTGEMEPGTETFFNCLTDEDKPRFLANFENAVSIGEVKDIDLCIKTPSGQLKRIRTMTRIQKKEDGSFIPNFGIIWDITENFENLQELKKARDQALEQSQAKTQFLSRMSHELRTPLNAILGFSELFLENLNGKFSEKDLEGLNEIHNAGHHLLTLINDVLDIANVESGKINLKLERVDLFPVIQNSLKLIQPQAEKRNIVIENHIVDSELPVHCDPFRIKQILINLLTNAVKYNSSPGKIILSSEISQKRVLKLTVSDTGIGIDEEMLQKIFDPFVRISMGNEIEGAGIGLSICKTLSELMNCRIEVESKVGVGSSFHLLIPMTD